MKINRIVQRDPPIDTKKLCASLVHAHDKMIAKWRAKLEMRRYIFEVYLKPLIKYNYAARARGELPDEWFWADILAVKWGYFVEEKKG